MHKTEKMKNSVWRQGLKVKAMDFDILKNVQTLSCHWCQFLLYFSMQIFLLHEKKNPESVQRWFSQANNEILSEKTFQCYRYFPTSEIKNTDH